LEIHDNVVLTDLAYEKANRLGLRLVRDKPDNPPSAPVRPYISQKPVLPSAGPSVAAPLQASHTAAPDNVPAPKADGAELQQRIRSAVIARLGTQVDGKLLDVIIKRVLTSTGVK
jgi:hypothetical protein